MEDFMIFFGGAYAVKGEIDHAGNPPITKYRKWSSKEDVSMVAYVPIPYADLNDVSDNQFVMTPDNEKFDLLSIDTKLMQLAEIFLLYTTLNNSTSRPDIVIWDQSMSGVMASNDEPPEMINMVGNEIMGQKITYQDAVIAFSHPYQDDLKIPSVRSVEVYDSILKELMKGKKVNIADFAKENNLEKQIVFNKIKKYLLTQHSDTDPIAIREGDVLTVEPKWRNSWYNSVTMFQNFCNRLFNKKDSSVLIYKRYSDDGTYDEHWISPTDLKYLISIGLRAVVELAWENQVMLVGIVKDSASTHLSQKYLGTMRFVKAPGYQFDDVLLPWSDRLFLQALPEKNLEFKAPWSTIEFDSVFMTLHVQRNIVNNEPEITGVQGNILNKERLFFRSLAQFYLKRSGKKFNMGHVIFVDRLILPHVESNLNHIDVKSKELGTVKPFFFQNNSAENDVQEVMMYILKILTRNLFPEVIGYPDPLHKADWGAKSMNKKVANMIKSSGKFLKIRPLAKTLRQERGSRR
ncbi:hypothetical protein BG20_I1693 [Candidatus Nitrosarchaeum limnium BG20]|uniref:Uncharacterized protein n=2 Tax=Nitrosarchaeum TaxID=1007082 RepID=S2E5R4_9ARCH|nr:hypothetical protein BG20_I1693 [Candidatus Nitrosarchaeum limnium BG20]